MMKSFPYMDNVLEIFLKLEKLPQNCKRILAGKKLWSEKIVNSVNGQGKFDEFTKNDIDDVIKMFQELQTKVEG